MLESALVDGSDALYEAGLLAAAAGRVVLHVVVVVLHGVLGGL
jgi:hypothetical protein